MLDVHRLRSDHDLVRMVEERLSTTSVEGLRRSGTSLNNSHVNEVEFFSCGRSLC